MSLNFFQACLGIKQFDADSTISKDFGGKNSNKLFNDKNLDPFVTGDTRVGEFPGNCHLQYLKRVERFVI